jgi:hypothetical protein
MAVGDKHRTVYRSKDGDVEISTNIEGFKWPTREEKIAGLLSAGLIDQAEADRLRARSVLSTREGECGH